jgi:hypothetical protein
MLYIILFILLAILVIESLSAVIVHSSNYKYYRKYYKLLPTYEWYMWPIYQNNIESKCGSIIYFNDGSIKFPGSHYLHNYLPTYFDPYSLYWLLKYKRWFKKNVDISTLKYN